MKKGIVLLMCVVGVVSFSSCNSKKTAAETAKAHHENLQNRDYAAYVETIYWEEDMPPAVLSQQKAEHAQILQEKAQPMIDAKGGIKNVAVKSETVAPDGRTANVTLTNTYNNGDVEDIMYLLVLDEPNQEWKVKMGPDREVWKTVLANGTHESFKLKEADNREVLKAHLGDERDFIKEIDGEGRHVEKVKTDEGREVHKVIERENETVIKEKVDGEREVTRIPKE